MGRLASNIRFRSAFRRREAPELFNFDNIFEASTHPVLFLKRPNLPHVRVRSFESRDNQIIALSIVSFDEFSSSMRMVKTSVTLSAEGESLGGLERVQAVVRGESVSGSYLVAIAEQQGVLRDKKSLENPQRPEPNWDEEVDCLLRFLDTNYEIRVQVSNVTIMDCDFQWCQWSPDLQIAPP